MWGEFTLCLLATCNTIQAIQSSSTFFLPNPHFQILSPYQLITSGTKQPGHVERG